MAKTRPVRTKDKEKAANGFNINNIIPAKYQTAVLLGIIFVLFLIYFSPMYFGGKTFQSGDIVTSKSMSSYIQKDRVGYTLWNPYIFCGMPAYAMGVEFKWFNLIYVALVGVRKVFNAPFAVDYSTWTFFLLILSFTSYFLMKHLTQNRLISLFTALSTSFSTGIIVFLFIGHVTKLTALYMYPLIFLLLLRFQKKIKLLDVAILTIALQLFLQGWHVQIIFYTFFAIGIYFLYYFLRYLFKKEFDSMKQLMRSAVVFAAAVIIALLIQSDNLTQIYAYNPYSTRGTESILEKEAAGGRAHKSESMFYEYNTRWSFSPGEVATFVVPSFYGFGYSKYNGPVTNNQEYRVNTYFGQMDFVDVAMYMGVIVFFLALFAIITQWKNPFVQFLTILSAIALLISFGSTFPVAYDLMYNYFPFFDKFRVPSMILVLVQMSFPVLAGLGIARIISLREEKGTKAAQIVKYAAFAFSGLFVLSIVLSGSLRDGFISRMLDAARNQQQAEYFKQFSDYAADMFMGDLYLAFALTAVVFWMAWGYINARLSRDILVIGIIALGVFDLWRIDSRGAEYVDNQNIDYLFNTTPEYVTAIKNQNNQAPFRILNLKQDGSLGSFNQNSNYHAFFLLEDMYGYSGIKPRGYEDIMSVVGPANPTLWRMLNVRYIILDQAANFPGFREIARTQQGVVYEFTSALPRAYFVDSLMNVKPIDGLNMIKNNQFDPKKAAFVENSENIKIDRPDTTADVRITGYLDEHITMQAKATGNNFLFLGDTYYPNGWKAFVDGKETKIYRTNHNFRGIVVPQGEHKIEFKYAPASFFITQKIALILSALVLLLLAYGIFMEFRRNKANK